jgi:uncharacterized protein HemY
MSGRACLTAVCLLTLVGCVAPLPIEEYTIARAAVNSARESGSERLAAGIWYKAEENYRKGQKYLKDQDNESAKISFLKAIEFAEKAENASRLKKFESGETMQ